VVPKPPAFNDTSDFNSKKIQMLKDVVVVAEQSEKFHLGAPLTSSNCRFKRQDALGWMGTHMTITEYLAVTALVALILWAVMALLIQEM
jgi:hypothetical protein